MECEFWGGKKKIIQRDSNHSHTGETLICAAVQVDSMLEIWGFNQSLKLSDKKIDIFGFFCFVQTTRELPQLSRVAPWFACRVFGRGGFLCHGNRPISARQNLTFEDIHAVRTYEKA